MIDFPKHKLGTYFKHLPCTLCSSTDAMAFYPWNGDTHCFSCNEGTKGKYKMNSTGTGVIEISGEEQMDTNTESQGQKSYSTVVAPLYERKISREVCQKYGVKSRVTEDGTVVGIEFHYPDHDKNLIGMKVNTPATEGKKKGFYSVGDLQNAALFGMDKFSQGHSRVVVVTEGEIDTLSAYQMLGMQYPCISLKHGAKSVAAALKDLKTYSWIDSFEKIIISFDNDEHGKEAIKEISGYFSPEKIHVMHMSYKDANEYLVNGKDAEFKKEFWAARPAILDGILNLKDAKSHALVPANIEKIDYPWKKLNDLTRGIRMGEATTVLSGTGQGKTTLMQELVWHLLQTTEVKIGCMFIENSERDTVNNLVGTAMNYPLKFALENDEEFEHHKFEYDAQHGEGAFIKARDKAIAETVDSGRLWSIADTDYTVNNIEKVLARCRYFAKVLGCKVIFLDHISLLVSGGEYEGDERKALDEIATKLAMIVKELNIHLFLVTQANTPTGRALEEGGKTSINGVRGTRGVGHITHNMIGIERNGQSEDPEERNTTMLRVLKCRWTGRTGPSSSLLFNHGTYRMTEIFPDDPQSNPEDLSLSGDNDKPIMDLSKFNNVKLFPDM